MTAKNVETDLSCVGREKSSMQVKEKLFLSSLRLVGINIFEHESPFLMFSMTRKSHILSMKRHSPFFSLTFTKSEEYLPKTCPPHTSVWVSGGNAE